jgi:hypothetical protein
LRFLVAIDSDIHAKTQAIGTRVFAKSLYVM